MAQMRDRIEWPTLGLLAACYALWAAAVFLLPPLSLPLAITGTSVACALHSSLQHEIIHGHPFADKRLNASLVWPALGLFIPFSRFRDSHLAHHQDSRLTDPYDDPESNYLDAADWEKLPRPIQLLLLANNTLLGRIVLGPLIGQIAFVVSDLKAIAVGNGHILRGWLSHLLAATMVLTLVWLGPMPLWAYVAAAYIALSILKIRTFLEHQAHDHCGGRSVIIEDRGPLAWIFLNNNLHVVHHMHPKVPWYRLPALYRANSSRFVKRNQGYVYRSYAQVFARHLLRPKDPVPHPLWRRTPEPNDPSI